jgi:uncharacterized membrane protein YdjX (TVP38/TMEM64 family)
MNINEQKFFASFFQKRRVFFFKKKKQKTFALLVFGVLLLCGAVIAGRLWPRPIAAFANDAMHMTRALGSAGWVLAAGVQLLVAVCGILPASVGGFACGLAYGIVGGFVLSATGTIAGAMLAFLLSRSLFRPVIMRLLAQNPRIARLESGVAQDGWRLVALLRCSPIMPFAVTSYAFGMTSISLRAYLLGTLASLPALLGYVMLGDLAGAGVVSLAAQQQHEVHLALLALAIVATSLLTWRIGRIVQRVLAAREATLAADIDA